MNKRNFELLLLINDHFKTVPYQAVDRGNGHPNHGFKVIKGTLEEAAKIAEVQDEEHLKNALIKINDHSTALFTIGCEKAFNQDGTEFWARGFLEFAFNYPQLVDDAQNYFKLFFNFNEYLRDRKFNEPVRYQWELEGNRFVDVGCDGFSVVVWITTAIFNNPEEPRRVWGIAVDHLTEYLENIKAISAPSIY
ncbi:MAG TPA: hypothetical protein VGP08_25695 [Pyrinomonadaceae bacterium]|jgi:hypothetical protein|nr:hypothetical protein [Pyrinomonadaceae bacterium]